MARFELDAVVTQSVLDRLIDEDPREQVEAAMTRAQSVRALKASVRRDLEWLLNTRQAPRPAGDGFPEAGRSLYNYGFPDFNSFSFANPKDRVRLVKTLETVVRTFEPRLKEVRVVLIETDNHEMTRAVRFRIEGYLDMDPSPEQVTFDTTLSLTNGEYSVKGERS